MKNLNQLYFNLMLVFLFSLLTSEILAQKSELLKNYNPDIIFLDPPYKEKNINNLFLTIFENKLLNKNGIIILHRKK